MRAAQRAIFFVQRELETIALAEDSPAMIVCDRGTIDGLAYWTGSPAQLFTAFRTTYTKELARYSGVIHIETPGSSAQYRRNAIRQESVRAPRSVDDHIAKLWNKQPNRMRVDAQQNFLDKARHAIDLHHQQLSECGFPHAGLRRSERPSEL